MNLNKITGFALLVIGCGLFYYGWQAQDSIASHLSNTVTGAPTDKTMALLGLGVLVGATGLYTLVFRGMH